MTAARKIQFQEMAIRKIEVDEGLQSRVEINHETAKDYMDALLSGSLFPPVIVFFDGVMYWLADGFHRVDAYRKAGRTSIPAEVKNGSRTDALIFSAGANVKMGMRPSAEDKRKAVRMILSVPECAMNWPSTKIARHCGVSSSTVTDVRNEMGTRRYLKSRTGNSKNGYGGSRPNSGRKPTKNGARERLQNSGFQIGTGHTTSAGSPDLVLQGAICGVMDHPSSGALCMMFGCVLVWRHKIDPTARAIVVGDLTFDIIPIASVLKHYGVEFLSPEQFAVEFGGQDASEEIAQPYAPQEGQADQGGNGFQGGEA